MVEATRVRRKPDRSSEEGRPTPYGGGHGIVWRGESRGRRTIVERGREKERDEERRREREGTRRNQSGSVARSRGEERGPACRTATHCPTHPAAALVAAPGFCRPIQETPSPILIVQMRCDRRLSSMLCR